MLAAVHKLLISLSRLRGGVKKENTWLYTQMRNQMEMHELKIQSFKHEREK